MFIILFQWKTSQWERIYLAYTVHNYWNIIPSSSASMTVASSSGLFCFTITNADWEHNASSSSTTMDALDFSSIGDIVATCGFVDVLQ